MAQDIINENQKISYTNLDFSGIYTETLDLIKKLTYRWDPSISDESDPGVVLVKLSALLADKLNYNIDKNILETFPLSVTQDGNARQLYDQLGYYMDWYQSGSTPITLTWIGATEDTISTYKIPRFTPICDSEQTSSKRYTLIGTEGASEDIVSDILLSTDGKEVIALALEGFPVQYQYSGETTITSQMVDPISHRLYFITKYISQNGIFIKNKDQDNYAEWKRVNNLYENSFNELRYIFGYDSQSDTCYLEFPDNYAELIGSGIEITYLVIDPTAGNVKANELVQFMSPLTIKDGNINIVLGTDNVSMTNYIASSGHSDIEGLNEAYANYKKTVGTFKTLITLRDYLNYIRNEDLNICSNAFVCDRTNDVQTVYRIINKGKSLDNILVKVEKVVEKTTEESIFDYKFKLTSDTTIISGKTYYTVLNDILREVQDPTGNPRENGYYEFESRSAKAEDSLEPFTLKFYLLKKGISLNSKAAYEETFRMMNPQPDFDSLFSDTAHLEHVYGEILPKGKDGLKKSTDEEFSENKSYWLYDINNNEYNLIPDISRYSSESPAELSNVYDLDVEALMPHTVFFKALYPLELNISTYSVLDSDTQDLVLNNIINALYEQTASSEMEFGEEVSVDYISTIARDADTRIKAVTVAPIHYYLYATYYDDQSDSFIEVAVDNDMGKFEPDSYQSDSDLMSSKIKKDIVTKSILAGVTQLIIPDTDFMYHLSQNFIAYWNDISSITSEAIIDISKANLSYAIDSNESLVRKTYTLKDNETLLLYRPQLIDRGEFLNGIHYEYLIKRDIKSDTSYKLATGEYFILYDPIRDETSNAITGYTAHSCGNGCIIHASFDITAQTSTASLSNFARTRIIPWFELNALENYYTVSTYNNTYMTEIKNSSSIIHNSISGSDSVKIQDANTIELLRGDKYKFYWVLNSATYSSNENLKTYTLFDSFDSEVDSKDSDLINSYTLRDGEIFIYMNSEGTSYEVLGAGTTIIRNCGVEDADKVGVKNSIYYACTKKLSTIVDNADFDELLDGNGVLKPRESGLYEVPNEGWQEVTDTENKNPYEENWYEAVFISEGENDEVDYFLPSTDITANPTKTYYIVDFVRSFDVTAISNKSYYVLVMHKESGWYTLSDDGKTLIPESLSTGCFQEISFRDYENPTLINPIEENYYKKVTYNKSLFKDTYSLSEGYTPTTQDRYTLSQDIFSGNYNDRGGEYFEHDSTVVNRFILADTVVPTIDISNINTYVDLDLSTDNFSPSTLKLLEPKNYKTYYEDDNDAPKETPIEVDYLTDPYTERLWVEIDGEKYKCFDPENYPEYVHFSPMFDSIELTNNVALFNEYDATYTVDTKNKGYYYKPNSIGTTYRYIGNTGESYISASKAIETSYPPIQTLYNSYVTVSQGADYPVDDTQTTWLSEISNAWSSDVSFMPPFINEPNEYAEGTTYSYSTKVKKDDLYYKCIVELSDPTWVSEQWARIERTWRTFSFIESGSHFGDAVNLSELYVKVSSQKIIDKQITGLGVIYPEFTDTGAGFSSSNFFVSAIYGSVLDVPVGDPLYQKQSLSVELNSDRKLALLFPGKKNTISDYASIGIYYLPKLYRFNDYVRYTDTNYYVLKDLYTIIIDSIDAWTVSALSTDEVQQDPKNVIQNRWASIQTNTSITIIANDTEKFGAGDKIVFEVNEIDEESIDWPIFSNSETILDTSKYDIFYQKKGEDIQELEKIDVADYKWRGYSSLILSASNTNGQKLNGNHIITLYENEGDIDPKEVIYGDDDRSITIQLKDSVSNASGTFINVATKDTLGTDVPNAVYVFEPFTEGDYFKYNTLDNTTSLTFNVHDENTDTYYPQEIEVPFGLPGGEYLLGVFCKDGINLRVIGENMLEVGDGIYNMDAPVIDGDSGIIIDPTFKNYLHPYVDIADYIENPRIDFTGAKYNYIYMNTGEGEFRKIISPSLLTSSEFTPIDLGWYENIDGDYVLTEKEAYGEDLLEEFIDQSEDMNPKELGWYVKENDILKLATETSADSSKIYYAEPELYVKVDSLRSQLIFSIDKDDIPTTYTLDDILKFEPNSSIGNFDTIKKKIRELDLDEEYSYTFVPNKNDLISNPLEAKSFFNPNHIYNRYIISQLDFENLDARFTTIR